MKIIGFVKKRKIMVVVCCMAMLMIGAFVCMAAWWGDARAESVAEEAGRQAREQSGADVQEEKAGSAFGQQTGDEAKQGKSVEEKTNPAALKNKESPPPASSPKSQDSNNNHTGNGISKEASTAGKAQPVHQHEWKAIEAVQETEKKIPIYGDKCNTCHQNITGFAEDHISNTNCGGYSTDVIVGYECKKEKTVIVTGYLCSCGASK